MMKNVNEGKGLFAPLVVLTRQIVGKKRFNQLRGKAIALHSQPPMEAVVGTLIKPSLERSGSPLGNEVKSVPKKNRIASETDDTRISNDIDMHAVESIPAYVSHLVTTATVQEEGSAPEVFVPLNNADMNGSEKKYAVLIDGPWVIFGSYLTVQPWSHNFGAAEKLPSQVGLSKSTTTPEPGRGKFVLVAVVVDLNKPLLPCIDGFIQKLEYEGLQNIYFQFGVYGHSKDRCNISQTTPMNTEKTNSTSEVEVVGDKGKREDLYGPWMIATGCKRRINKSKEVENGNPNLDSETTMNVNGGAVMGKAKGKCVIAERRGSSSGPLNKAGSSRASSKPNAAEPEQPERNRMPLQEITSAQTTQSSLEKVEVAPTILDNDTHVQVQAPNIVGGSHLAVQIKSTAEKRAGIRKRVVALKNGSPLVNYNPSMGALLETRISGSRADDMIRTFSFSTRFAWRLMDSVADLAVVEVRYLRGDCNNFKSILTYPGVEHPWLLGGDFNALLNHDERQGGAMNRVSPSNGFSSFVFNNGLMLSDSMDPISLGREAPCIRDWIAAWEMKNGCVTSLKLTEKLTAWNINVFGDIGKRKKQLLARLRVGSGTRSLWQQKARCGWILDGDRNTKFYHASAKIRHRRNTIALKMDDGNWCSDQSRLKQGAVDFFRTLFSSGGIPMQAYNTRGHFFKFPTEIIGALSHTVLNEEVKQVILDMQPSKAPGIYGFHAAFTKIIGILLALMYANLCGIALGNERLAQSIANAISNRSWKPIKLSRSGPPLSHLFFADNLVLFAEASVSQLAVIKSILAEFCEVQDTNSRDWRGMDLVKWDDLCKPTEIGGIGIKKVHVQSKAFLMKLAFRLIPEDTQLWARVLISKYKIKDLVPSNVERRGCSRLWKGVSCVWNDVQQNLIWNLHTLIDFWYDAWLIELGPLVNHLTLDGVIHPKGIMVSALVNSDGEWRWDLIRDCIPNMVCLSIASCSICGATVENCSHILPECSIAIFRSMVRNGTSVWVDDMVFVESMQQMYLRHGFHSQRNYFTAKDAVWKAPPVGWMKLNTDGARHSSTGLTTCGGIIRNQSIETGSKEAIAVLSSMQDSHNRSAMVPHITSLVQRDYRLHFNYVPQESNKVADSLAKLAWKIPAREMVFAEPPMEV
ncbi:hypothetical protein F3Y22_tig00110474pilonHSYRG00005 [Hibiscus syriacus]|uniref:RNase H type-1 domain-containing protein n=1 Tax=Hibiscus syriacus TaxID=106335 RepID=A0A6A3AG43_HIBSY|nr:hypothetical protein F3Y22_tig00110474pilonHSYRG00005 [Hibiscus syriacus]